MQKIFLQRSHDVRLEPDENIKRRLILFFAGWGVDATIFTQLSKPGYDILLVYDYRDDAFSTSDLERYDEICVLAWSLGVWHADRFISVHPELPFTRTIAVNGTLSPISDTCGIPPRIYDLTSLLPDDASLLKFYRRICGGQAALNQLMPVLPERHREELRDELLAIRRRIAVDADIDVSNWDEIYLSDADQIFPFENMQRAWSGAAQRVRVLKGVHHAIDFGRFIASAFVDKELVGGRFASASASYEREAEVQRKVAQMLVQSVSAANNESRSNCSILEVGSGVGVLTKLYQPLFADSRILLWDLAPVGIEPTNGNRIDIEACDAEIQMRSMPDASLDFIFSSSTIQWFNSPRRFLREVARVLSPGGKAYISCYVDGTLPQLSMLSESSSMHYPQLDDVISSMPQVRCKAFEKKLEITFDSPVDALAHMRSTGVNSLARKAMSVADTRRLMKMIVSDSGKAVLTFNTMFIIIEHE